MKFEMLDVVRILTDRVKEIPINAIGIVVEVLHAFQVYE